MRTSVFLTARSIGFLVAALLSPALFAGSAGAAEPTYHLAEACRIQTTPSATLADALPALRSCAQPAERKAVGTIWVLYSELPMLAEAGRVWRLELDNNRARSADIWLLKPGGRTQQIRYDPQSPAREWATANYFSLPFHGDRPISGIVVRLGGAESMTYVRAPRLTTARDYATNDRNHAALYGAAAGMLAVTILFHASLFVAIRRRFQLIYCFHAALMFLYALGYSGLIRLVAPELTAIGVSKLVNFSMIAGTGTGIAFLFDFLGRGVLPRFFRRWGGAAAIASFACAFALVATPQRWSADVYIVANLVTLHTILFGAACLAFAIGRRNQTAVLLALGWALPMAVALLYPARNFGLISDLVVPDGLMLLAVTLEVLVLSLPVASRIRSLRIEHERAEERHAVLERQAQTDALTGLANRRGFGVALTRAAAAQAEPAPIALLVIDIDHFKRVNDRHGHATGDAILQHVAAHVARMAGSGAIVSRFGGEEFVVALRGLDLPRATTVAERIRISMGTVFGDQAALPPVTVSIGVAGGTSDRIDQIMADADCALYRAKNEGRNRVMVADGPLMYAAAA